MSYESLTEKLLKGKKEEKFFVSVVPVSPSGEVLLGRRTEDGIWTTPGGGAEPGEDPSQAARRELFEEAGLVAPPNALELVKIGETPRGFKIYSFLWRMPGLFAEAATPKLDPDKEVKAWKLFRPEDFPSAMSSEQNASRLTTIREALMHLYGINKSTSMENRLRSLYERRTDSANRPTFEEWAKTEKSKAIASWMFAPESQMETIEDLTEDKVVSLIDKLNKGGEGSGVKGHMTNHPNAPARPAVNSAPANPINKLQAHLHALEHGGVMPGLRTESGKPVVNNMDMARAQGYDVQDHVDAMNTHYELAQKTQAMLEKLKTAGHKIPAEGGKIARFHEKMMKEHMRARQYLEQRTKHTAEAIKEKPSVRKSSTQMGNSVGDRDLDISSFAQASSNGHSAWMETLYTGMDGFQFADTPRVFDMPKGVLTIAKVDDGLYSGFFTKFEDGMQDNAKVRIERMTIPELVQFMTAKEWIKNPIMDAPVDTTAEMGQLEHPQAPASGESGYTDDFTTRLNEKLLAPVPTNEIYAAPPTIMVPQVHFDATEQRIRLLELVAKLIT